ncbi:MAG: hypothetical protein J6P13_05360 [Kiritimatiellae bacterium]|nr:hypothetical protein [Kiritimatiellia bacterium]
MKKLIMVLASAVLAGMAWARGVEQISVVENEIATISVPFGITSYLPSNKDVVRIEELSSTSLRITALRRGRCDLEVRGDKDLTQKYEITVLGDLATTLDTLSSELDQVQEVRARIVGDFIRIDGEVSAIQKWEYLQKVLRNYPGVVRNFAIFTPGPDVMLRLKDTLLEAGFKVSFQSLGKDRKAWPANTISLVLNKQTQIMTVQGRVYTPEQQAKVLDCLSTERWLVTSLKPAEDASTDDEYKIRTQFDVFVDKPQIRVSVAYLAVGETDLKQIGNENARERGGVFNMGGVFDILTDLIHGHHGSDSYMGGSQRNGRRASVGANLSLTANFLKDNGITRMSDTGYTVMQSWDKEGSQFKSGGKKYLAVYGEHTGELKEIDYGFVLKTQGGVVPEGDAVEMLLDLSITSPVDGGYGNWDQSEEFTKQRVTLELGKTTFLGGVKLLDESRISPSGIPYLRNTPLLSWFVADSGHDISDRRLVFMVCPELIDNATGEKIDTKAEIDLPVTVEGAKTTEQREKETLEKQYPFGGGLWNPLNWFVF